MERGAHRGIPTNAQTSPHPPEGTSHPTERSTGCRATSVEQRRLARQRRLAEGILQQYVGARGKVPRFVATGLRAGPQLRRNRRRRQTPQPPGRLHRRGIVRGATLEEMGFEERPVRLTPPPETEARRLRRMVPGARHAGAAQLRLHPRKPLAQPLRLPEEIDYQRARPLRPTGRTCRRASAPPTRPGTSPKRCDSEDPLIYLSICSLGSADDELMRMLIAELGNQPYRVIVFKGPRQRNSS